KPPPSSVASPALTIEPAGPADAGAIAHLLCDARLPHEDFAAHWRTFLVARRGGDVVGAIGAEVLGAEALLRSLVVAPAERGGGLGGRLVDALERAGMEWGVARWWLLTMTAEDYFARRGFQAVERSTAPAAVAATREFRTLCPASAACM